MEHIDKHRNIYFAVSVLFLFVILCALPKLNLPGLGGDESTDPRILIQMFQFNDPQVAFRTQIFGKIFPILDRPYQSSLYVYLYLPFAYIGGINVYTIRLSHIFYGLIILLLYYLFTKELLGSKKALMALLLLATLPFFIIGIKTDGEYYIYMIPILIFLLFSLRFYNSKKKIYFYLSSFILGIGVYYSALSLIFILSSLLIIFICYFRKIKINSRQVLCGLFFFLLGSSPLICYNLKSADTIRYATSSFFKENYISEHNPYNLQTFSIQSVMIMIEQNVITRIKTLTSIMMGSSFFIKTTILIITKNFLNLFLVLFALIFSIFRIISRKTPKEEKIKLKMVLYLLVFFILLSSLIPSHFLRDYHLIMAIPLLFILSVNSLDFLYKKYRILIIILFLLIIGINLVILAGVYKHFLDYGFWGPEHPSDSIYALGDYLYKNKITLPIGIGTSYGREDFQNSVTILTKGISGTSLPFNLFRMQDSKKHFFDFAKNPENVYILPAANIRYEGERETLKLFKDYAKEANKTLVIKTVFTDRAGQPEFIVYKLK